MLAGVTADECECDGEEDCEPEDETPPEAAPPSLGDVVHDPVPNRPSSRPAGVDAKGWDAIKEVWDQLNDMEKKLCKRSFAHCGAMAVQARLAINFADQLYPVGEGTVRPDTGRRNSPNDALKHARWVGGMYNNMMLIPSSPLWARDWARAFLHAHETASANDVETEMDWHNNNVGLDLVDEGNVAGFLNGAVERAWREGRLQEWACPDHPTNKAFGCIPGGR